MASLLTHFATRVAAEQYLIAQGFSDVTARTWLHNDCATFAVLRPLAHGSYVIHYTR